MKSLKLLLLSIILLFVTSPVIAHKAIIMAYYGTNNDSARVNTLDAMTKMVGDSFPKYTVAEAYTSPIIIHSLERRGIRKPFVDEAIDSLYALGFDTIVIANCQLLDDASTHDIEKAADSRSDSILIGVTQPILYNSSDCKWLSELLTLRIDADSTKQVVLVGHGSADSSNGMYALLDYVLQHNGHQNYHVGTIENYPDLKTIEDILRNSGTKDVILYPLLAISGHHTLKDINGKWKNTLTDDGYSVTIINEALLGLPAVRKRILENIRKQFSEITDY